jgi:hypothetical protein
LVTFNSPSTEDILKELAIPSYLPSGDERDYIIIAAQEALKSMEARPADYRLHVENVHKFMKAL